MFCPQSYIPRHTSPFNDFQAITSLNNELFQGRCMTYSLVLVAYGNDNPPQYSCLGKSHGQRILAGYSPWGPKRVGHGWVTDHICGRHLMNHASLNSNPVNSPPSLSQGWPHDLLVQIKLHGRDVVKVLGLGCREPCSFCSLAVLSAVWESLGWLPSGCKFLVRGKPWGMKTMWRGRGSSRC